MSNNQQTEEHIRCCIIQHFELPFCLIKHATNPTINCTYPCTQILYCTPHTVYAPQNTNSIAHPFRWSPFLINYFPHWEQMVPFGQMVERWGREVRSGNFPANAGSASVCVCACTDAYVMLKDTFIWTDLLWWSQASLSIYDPCGLHTCRRWHNIQH